MKRKQQDSSNKEEPNSLRGKINDRLPSRISINPTESKAVNTIIAVALLTLIAVGFAVAFQQIGIGFIQSVEEPVQATIDVNPDQDQVDLTIQEMSDNVDTMSINVDADDAEIEDHFSDEWESGEDDDDGFYSVNVGDTATIGGENGDLDEGDQIVVVARDDPDNTGVVLDYTHEIAGSDGD